jgi:peptidoglycan hydrolase-like protein with peptidoglycan-binding domain
MGLYKILEDGIWGNQTFNSVSKLPLLKIGSNNAVVGWMLGVLGCSQDCIFGNITYSKLKDYQAKNSLLVDGIAGQQTIKYMLTS